jgi:hypothetical protein
LFEKQKQEQLRVLRLRRRLRADFAQDDRLIGESGRLKAKARTTAGSSTTPALRTGSAQNDRLDWFAQDDNFLRGNIVLGTKLEKQKQEQLRVLRLRRRFAPAPLRMTGLIG